MPHTIPNRRDVLRSALALLPGAALDWNSLPRAQAADTSPDHFDAVIVGSGLGGLANIPIQQAEEVLLPGLSKAIEVKEVATPPTNVRNTGNYHGANLRLGSDFGQFQPSASATCDARPESVPRGCVDESRRRLQRCNGERPGVFW